MIDALSLVVRYFKPAANIVRRLSGREQDTLLATLHRITRKNTSNIIHFSSSAADLHAEIARSLTSQERDYSTIRDHLTTLHSVVHLELARSMNELVNELEAHFREKSRIETSISVWIMDGDGQLHRFINNTNRDFSRDPERASSSITIENAIRSSLASAKSYVDNDLYLGFKVGRYRLGDAPPEKMLNVRNSDSSFEGVYAKKHAGGASVKLAPKYGSTLAVPLSTPAGRRYAYQNKDAPEGSAMRTVVFGSLSVEHEEPGFFKENEISFVEIIADFMASYAAIGSKYFFNSQHVSRVLDEIRQESKSSPGAGSSLFDEMFRTVSKAYEENPDAEQSDEAET